MANMVDYKKLISEMTLEEKASLFSGEDMWKTKAIERLGIPSITLSDGPHGVRRQLGAGDHLGLNASLPATCFPSAATVANSWDPSVAELIGRCIAEEALEQGVDVILGPGLNMKRSPLCGRNFEYYSEDPYLCGKMAAAEVKGIQSKGLSACPKHYAVNSQELRRMSSDSVIDERALREIYLTAFEIVVKESRPRSLMSSYNRINGVYASENQKLLQSILRDEWNFDGFVVTDWGGSNNHVESLKAGNHLEMPGTGGDSDKELAEAVKKGVLNEELLDQRAEELLRIIYELHSVSQEPPAGEEEKAEKTNEHHKAAQKAAAESIVLLKNEDQILPLSPNCKVAIVGDFAENPRYQGFGSSVVNCTRLDNTLDLLKEYDIRVTGFEKGYDRNNKDDAGLMEAAAELAERSDVVLLYMGLNEISECEGVDREHMRIPMNQISLLMQLAEVNENIIAVISAGSAIEMPWIDRCKGAVHGYLGGQAGAGAMLQVLTGQVCPGGKLAETFPIKYEDTPAYSYYPGKEYNAEYRESIYMGYRYYEKTEVPVRFPFGYGLSYTTFSYSDLEAGEKEVSFVLANTGSRDGAEVVQLYIGAENSAIYRPKKELKGFAKVFLKAGEMKKVTIPLDEKAFRYFNTGNKKWEVEEGEYHIFIGASSADIRLKKSIYIEGVNAVPWYDKNLMASYESGRIKEVSDSEFSALLGRDIPDGHWDESGPLYINDSLCQMYYAKSGLARLVYQILKKMKERSEKKGVPDLNILFIYNMPFRAIAKMMGGMVTMEMVNWLLHMINGHFCQGITGMAKAFVKSRKMQKPKR